VNLSFDPGKTKILFKFPYSPLTISHLHNVPGARYSSKNTTNQESVWIINKDIPSVRSLLGYFPMVHIDDEINSWMKDFDRRESSNKEQKKQGTYDPKMDNFSFVTTPYHHQKVALDLIIKNKSFGLCMEMGTGKTKPIIDLMSELKRYKVANGISKIKCLVVAPLSVVPNWEKEVSLHGENLVVSLVVGSRAQRMEALNVDADIFVINYSGVRIFEKTLCLLPWDIMVCDESQNIKHRTSQQAKACYAIGAKAKRRYILTGTMVTNKPLDVFGQFKFLDESILGKSYTAFQSRYAVMVTHGRSSFPVRFINLGELAQRISPWSYRVLKSECLDLPPKVYQVRYAEMSSDQKKLYTELKRELASHLKSGELVTAPIILTKLIRFSQITAGFVTTSSGEVKEIGDRGKIKTLVEVLSECEGKSVVWVKFKKEMELIKSVLGSEGISHVSLSGDNTSQERQESIERFGSDPNIKVFLGQIEAGGTGINLTAASTCIYMTNSYSLGTRLQSEDRLHRIGQKSAVNYVDIVCPGTIDEKILVMLKSKKDIADKINLDKMDGSFLDSIV